MSERLTWQQICEQYPNQQVGLSEVEWVDDDCITVKSAVVKLTEADHSRREIISICAMSDGELYSENTTPDKFWQAFLGIDDIDDLPDDAEVAGIPRYYYELDDKSKEFLDLYNSLPPKERGVVFRMLRDLARGHLS